jgi:hypothetical protein
MDISQGGEVKAEYVRTEPRASGHSCGLGALSSLEISRLHPHNYFHKTTHEPCGILTHLLPKLAIYEFLFVLTFFFFGGTGV